MNRGSVPRESNWAVFITEWGVVWIPDFIQNPMCHCKEIGNGTEGGLI